MKQQIYIFEFEFLFLLCEYAIRKIIFQKISIRLVLSNFALYFPQQHFQTCIWSKAEENINKLYILNALLMPATSNIMFFYTELNGNIFYRSISIEWSNSRPALVWWSGNTNVWLAERWNTYLLLVDGQLRALAGVRAPLHRLHGLGEPQQAVQRQQRHHHRQARVRQIQLQTQEIEKDLQ